MGWPAQWDGRQRLTTMFGQGYTQTTLHMAQVFQTIANGMEKGFAELVNREDTPHLVRWIEQINARLDLERPAGRRARGRRRGRWTCPCLPGSAAPARRLPPSGWSWPPGPLRL